MRYVVDPALCCAHGRCVEIAPSVYDLDADGFNVQAGSEAEVPSGHEDDAVRGAQSCPDGAIQILP
jgi:ferredoxin